MHLFDVSDGGMYKSWKTTLFPEIHTSQRIITVMDLYALYALLLFHDSSALERSCPSETNWIPQKWEAKVHIPFM